MDDETRVLLSGTYQELDAHASGLTELRIVVLALVNTIQELGLEATTLYAKHYGAQNLLRPADALRHASLPNLSIDCKAHKTPEGHRFSALPARLQGRGRSAAIGCCQRTETY